MLDLVKEIKKEVEQFTGARRYSFTNRKGESVLIEVRTIETDPKDKKSLPNLWLKHGLTTQKLYTYLCARCYVTDKDGYCWERYNPTIKESDDGKRMVINFDWNIEGTEQNEVRTVNEVYRLANA